MKAARNIRLHDVTFEEATEVFGDPLVRFFEDPDHSSPGDERFIAVGITSALRLLFVVFSELEPDEIRIISAREATQHERRQIERE